MKVILLETVKNLGSIGDQVIVKPGYARNYLMPTGKVVLATAANIVMFEERRAELEQAQLAKLEKAKERIGGIAGITVTIASQVSEGGKLYGSVHTSDIAKALDEQGFQFSKNEIHLLEDNIIRQIGDYEAQIILHNGEVKATFIVSVVSK